MADGEIRGIPNVSDMRTSQEIALNLLPGGTNPATTTIRVNDTYGLAESCRVDGISVDTKMNIIDLFAQTGDFTLACNENGVNPRTGRWHLQNDAKFRELMQEARHQISDKMEGTLVKKREKWPVASIFWLKSNRPEIYGEKVQVQNDTNITIQHANTARKYIEAETVE